MIIKLVWKSASYRLPLIKRTACISLSGKWDPDYWFSKYKAFELEKGPGCCSDSVISFHYVPPQQMYVYDYFIHRVGFTLGRTSGGES